MAHKYRYPVFKAKQIIAKAPMTEAQKAVNPNTRLTDAENLERLQQARPLRPPSKLRRANGQG
jgi:hypothetical protein